MGQNSAYLYSGGDSRVSWELYNGAFDTATAQISTARCAGNFLDACALTSTRGVVVVGNSANSTYGTAYLINLSTGAVLSTLVFKSTALTGVRVCPIDTRYFMVAYTTATTTEGGRIIDTNGDSLATVGSEQTLAGVNFTDGSFDIDYLDTNKIICGYDDATNRDGYAVVLSTNTTTGAITVGTPTAIITTVTLNANTFRIRATSTTSFVCFGGVSTNAYAGAGTVSGTSVTRVTSASLGAVDATCQILNIAANVSFTDFIMSNGGDDEASFYVTYNGTTFTTQQTICVAPSRDATFLDLATVNSVRYGLSVEFRTGALFYARGAKLDTTNKCVTFSGTGVDLGTMSNYGYILAQLFSLERISDTAAMIVFSEDATDNLMLHIARTTP